MVEVGVRPGMPVPDYDEEHFFDPLPGNTEDPPEWRDARHGLDSMNLMVFQKVGGQNERGDVEWLVNEQLMLRLSDPNTVRVRWNLNEVILERLGLSNPRVRLTIWRY